MDSSRPQPQPPERVDSRTTGGCGRANQANLRLLLFAVRSTNRCAEIKFQVGLIICHHHKVSLPSLIGVQENVKYSRRRESHQSGAPIIRTACLPIDEWNSHFSPMRLPVSPESSNMEARRNWSSEVRNSLQTRNWQHISAT